MQEESYEFDYNFSNIGDELLSYLHKIQFDSQSFFVSVIIQENLKEIFLEKFSGFIIDLKNILEPLVD
jgi:hypothetical protein